MTGNPLPKHRELFFAEFPPDQIPGAVDALRSLEQVSVELLKEKQAIGIDYDLHAHSLAELEEFLTQRGFRLDDTLLAKLTRALIHYAEETQLHNLEAPDRLPAKKAQQEAYIREWEHHPHGDHDETPPEWREYK